MATADSLPVEIKGLIISLNANYNYTQVGKNWEFPQRNTRQTPTRQDPPRTQLRIPRMQIDTENIRVTFAPASPETGNVESTVQSQINSNSGSIIMKRDDIKRLNVTVGDKIALRVTKE